MNLYGSPKAIMVHGHEIRILIDGQEATHLVLDATLGSTPEQGVTFSPVINLNPIVNSDWDGQLSYAAWKESQYGKTMAKIHAGEYIFSKKDVVGMMEVPAEELWAGPPEDSAMDNEAVKMERIAKKMIKKQKGKEN